MGRARILGVSFSPRTRLARLPVPVPVPVPSAIKSRASSERYPHDARGHHCAIDALVLHDATHYAEVEHQMAPERGDAVSPSPRHTDGPSPRGTDESQRPCTLTPPPHEPRCHQRPVPPSPASIPQSVPKRVPKPSPPSVLSSRSVEPQALAPSVPRSPYRASPSQVPLSAPHSISSVTRPSRTRRDQTYSGPPGMQFEGRQVSMQHACRPTPPRNGPHVAKFPRSASTVSFTACSHALLQAFHPEGVHDRALRCHTAGSLWGMQS